MLCSQGFEVNNYDFTLGRLAYENLRLVQNSGIRKVVLQSALAGLKPCAT